MSFQISFLGKAFSALGTLERFLSCVGPVVNVESRLLAIALVATRELTRESFVLIVDFKVRIALSFR